MTDALRDDQLERIVTAVETVETSLEILARKRAVSRESYKSDREMRDIVERRFVTMTEAALDIGSVLLVEERGRPAESNPGTMRALAADGILSEETAEAMANAARFRNVLAHTYGPIVDDDTVYDALQDLERYRSFAREISAYLDSTGALDE